PIDQGSTLFPTRRSSDLEQRVTSNGSGRQLVGTVSDDADHAGSHPVKHRLHPGKATVECIEPAEGDHHEERRPDKGQPHQGRPQDRKSTRLNSSHEWISY